MNDRVHDILERWEAETREGRTVTAEELCRDCKELIPEVHRRIHALAATAWLEEPSSPSLAVEASEAEILEHLPSKFGRYEVKGLIGEGGFGYVLKGYDPDIRREIAIKVLKPERLNHSGADEAFLDEARHVAGLRHPGIVPVYDVGQHEGHCFIVSEYIKGQSLAEYLNGVWPTVPEALRLVRDVAQILRYAHEQGYVHRDVKPANILLDNSGNVYLTDFGIAIYLHDAERSPSRSAGTLAYMAPEQLSNGTIDRQSDIYSLGVVLFQLLYGYLPGEAARPSHRLERSIPSALRRIGEKCLAREPSLRYDNMLQLAQALDAYVEPKPSRFSHLQIGLWLIVLGGVGGAATYLHSGNSKVPAVLLAPSANVPPNEGSKPTVLDSKTQDYMPSPTDYGRVDGNTLSVGMGARPDGVGFGAAGILLERVSTIHVKVKTKGVPRVYDRNSFLGFILDFETSKGFVHRIALPFSFYSERRWATCPDWGKAGLPNRIIDVGEKELYVIDLEEIAPADWSGRVWLTALCQNAGKGVQFDATIFKVTASTRPSPRGSIANKQRKFPVDSAAANLGTNPSMVNAVATDSGSGPLRPAEHVEPMRLLIRWPGDTEILQVAIASDGHVQNESDPILSGVAKVVEDGNIAIRFPHRTLLYSPSKQNAIWLSEHITLDTAQPQQVASVQVLNWPQQERSTGREKLPTRVRLHWNDGLEDIIHVDESGGVTSERWRKNSGRLKLEGDVVVLEGFAPGYTVFGWDGGRALRGKKRAEVINSWRAKDKLDRWQHGTATVLPSEKP